MKIGELARRAGVPVDTVRYYERNGLLPAPSRSASGYRDFEDLDVVRLRFVLRAKTLGFTLAEVRDLAELAEVNDGDAEQIRAIAADRLAQIEARIAQLTRVCEALRAVLVDATHEGPLDGCPIRAAILDAVDARS